MKEGFILVEDGPVTEGKRLSHPKFHTDGKAGECHFQDMPALSGQLPLPSQHSQSVLTTFRDCDCNFRIRREVGEGLNV